MSSTSPAKCNPGTCLLSRVLGLISFKSMPPLVTKDLASDILPVTLIGMALRFFTRALACCGVSCLTFSGNVCAKKLARRSGKSIFRVFLSDFSRFSERKASKSSVDNLGSTSNVMVSPPLRKLDIRRAAGPDKPKCVKSKSCVIWCF